MTIEQLKKANELNKQIDRLETKLIHIENAYKITVVSGCSEFNIERYTEPQIFQMIKEYYEEKLKQAKEELEGFVHCYELNLRAFVFEKPYEGEVMKG